MNKFAGFLIALGVFCATICCADEVKKLFIEQEKPAQVVGARVDPRAETIKLREQLAEQDKLLQELHNNNEDLRRKISQLESSPDAIIAGLAAAHSQNGPAYVVIKSSDGCIPCEILINSIKSKYPQLIGTEFQIVKLTLDEWRMSQLSLPDVRLWADGEESDRLRERDPSKLKELIDKAAALQRDGFAAAAPASGLVVGSIPMKDQVQQMLQQLEPFLDGGTLELIYTPRKGIVKEFLTIKRGAVGVKIPPRTSLTLSMHNGDLTIKLNDPKPILLIGPLERGLQEIDITPNKMSIRLPWMIDPEVKWK